MTTATDELRKLLDERGVEYEAYGDVKNRCITKWRTYHGAFVFFAVEKEGKLFVETASDTEHSAICTPEQAIAATLGSGALTADDVLNAVYKHGARWQAIADELNAELGSGTCENKAKSWGEFECSECEFCADFGSDLHRVRLCPDCGRTVRA